MGLESPIPVSMKLGDNNNLFRRIVEAAQRPHLSIPETELGKSTKQHRQTIQRSLGYAVGMFLFPVLNLDMQICTTMRSSTTVLNCSYTLYDVIVAGQEMMQSSPVILVLVWWMYVHEF